MVLFPILQKEDKKSLYDYLLYDSGGEVKFANKLEIESSIAPLSAAGIKIHLGKGELHPETIEALDRYNSVYAVIPPVTALLGSKTLEQKVIAFPELGMEALHLIKVEKFPAIIAAAHGKSIYSQEN